MYLVLMLMMMAFQTGTHTTTKTSFQPPANQPDRISIVYRWNDKKSTDPGWNCGHILYPQPVTRKYEGFVYPQPGTSSTRPNAVQFDTLEAATQYVEKSCPVQ